MPFQRLFAGIAVASLFVSASALGVAQGAPPLTGFYTEADTFPEYTGNFDTGLTPNITARSHQEKSLLVSPGVTASGEGTAVADLSLATLQASAGLLSTNTPGAGDFGVYATAFLAMIYSLP